MVVVLICPRVKTEISIPFTSNNTKLYFGERVKDLILYYVTVHNTAARERVVT